jgi:hypothetical protein
MNLVNSVLQNSTFVSKMGYNALLTQANLLYPGIGPVLLHFFCIGYNLLNTSNKLELDNFIRNMFKEYYSKYEILTTLCKNETLNPLQFITTNRMYIEPVLRSLGINFPTTEDELKTSLNHKLDNIKGLINQQQQKILAILKYAKGGKSRKLRKKLKYVKTYKTKK